MRKRLGLLSFVRFLEMWYLLRLFSRSLAVGPAAGNCRSNGPDPRQSLAQPGTAGEAEKTGQTAGGRSRADAGRTPRADKVAPTALLAFFSCIFLFLQLGGNDRAEPFLERGREGRQD